MNHSIPNYFCAAVLAVLVFSFTPHAHAASDIQMMPPTDFTSTTGKCSQAGILFWDTTSPIHCIPGSSGDNSGNFSLSHGSLSATSSVSNGVNGATTSAIAWGGVFTGPLYGLYASGTTWAGDFNGPVNVTGALTVSGTINAGSGVTFSDGTTQTTANSGGTDVRVTSCGTLASYDPNGVCDPAYKTIGATISGCNRYCAQGFNGTYVAGTMVEYGAGNATCACFK